MKFHQFALAGLLGAAALYAAMIWISRDKAARIEGRITDVRTLGMDQRASVAIVDFESINPSDITMVIGERQLAIVDAKGIERRGSIISAADTKVLFDYFPALGRIRNEPVVREVKVASGEAYRGMVAARFELPKHELDRRREIILQVADIDGAISEISLESQ